MKGLNAAEVLAMTAAIEIVTGANTGDSCRGRCQMSRMTAYGDQQMTNTATQIREVTAVLSSELV